MSGFDSGMGAALQQAASRMVATLGQTVRLRNAGDTGEGIEAQALCQTARASEVTRSLTIPGADPTQAPPIAFQFAFDATVAEGQSLLFAGAWYRLGPIVPAMCGATLIKKMAMGIRE